MKSVPSTSSMGSTVVEAVFLSSETCLSFIICCLFWHCLVWNLTEFLPNCFPQTAQVTSPKRLLLSSLLLFIISGTCEEEEFCSKFFIFVFAKLGGGGLFNFFRFFDEDLEFVASLELSFALDESPSTLIWKK